MHGQIDQDKALAKRPSPLPDDHHHDGDDDDGGYPAYSHHDKIPPWWENVSNEGGNVSVSKTHHTPYTMMNYFLEYIYIR